MIKKIIAIIASIMPNFVKIQLYKIIGYKIGKNVKIKPLTLILANKVKIEDNVRIGALNILKMNELKIGKNSTIRSLNMMLGPRNLKLGKRTQLVGPFIFMNLAEDIELGDETGLGSHSIFYTHGVYLPYTEGHPRKFGKITLGKRIWSPAHVMFLPGVTVGDDSIISAGSLVNSSFPEDSLISGSPAKRIAAASRIKVKMNKQKLQKRMREMILDFTRNESLKFSKIKTKKNEITIIRNKHKYLVKLGSGTEKIDYKRYTEVIILGENLSIKKNSKLSTFDVKKKKMTLNGKLGEIFLEHLGTYGEYFNK